MMRAAFLHGAVCGLTRRTLLLLLVVSSVWVGGCKDSETTWAYPRLVFEGTQAAQSLRLVIVPLDARGATSGGAAFERTVPDCPCDGGTLDVALPTGTTWRVFGFARDGAGAIVARAALVLDGTEGRHRLVFRDSRACVDADGDGLCADGSGDLLDPDDDDECTPMPVESLCGGATTGGTTGDVGECVPDCADRVCGDDGCGGSCGECDDGLACTRDECDQGLCSFGFEDCDDDNPQSVDWCDEDEGGCQHTLADCDDQNACTEDAFDPALGACTSKPIVCEAGDCMVASCDAAVGCTQSAMPCDDGDACTQDECVPGDGCVFEPTDCDDQNACTTDGCDPASGACSYAAVDCEDQDPCTQDSCDEGTGCAHGPVQCADPCSANVPGVWCGPGDPPDGLLPPQCFPPTCVAGAGCSYSDQCTGCDSAAQCDDNNACTQDSCEFPGGAAQGVCQSATFCTDGDACTQDACDAQTGQCLYPPVVCNDGDACTQDACVAGQCVATPVVCQDQDPCTQDACSAVSGACVTTPVSCDDGDLCTEDACTPQVGCTAGPVDCDDGNPCTQDSCQSASGACVHVLPDCDDSDACTLDGCEPQTGACIHVPSSCPDDGDVCTEIACDPLTGCHYPPLGCDDADACTVDSCLAPEGCRHEPVHCDDEEPCTQDSCVDGQCQSTAAADGMHCAAAGCIDGALVEAMTCVAGQCTGGGGATPCDGGFGCEDATHCASSCASHFDCAPGFSCDAPVCVATGQNGAACQSDEQCASGHCQGGFCCDPGGACCASDAGCDDGNACTDDACVGFACTSTAVEDATSCGPSACSNGSLTTPWCQAGQCVNAGPAGCAGGFACADGTSCATSCGDDAGCQSGFVCSGQSCTGAGGDGETCATAFWIGALPFSDSGSTVGASADVTDGCATDTFANGAGSGDRVYALQVTTAGKFRFALEASHDALLYLTTDCASPAACLADDDEFTDGGEEIVISLAAGTTVYVVVDGWGGSSDVTGTYVLSVEVLPPTTLDCGSYCEALETNCDGADSPYPNDDCAAVCASGIFPSGTLGATSGNTLACRLHHAEAAPQGDAVAECAAAGPQGAGTCGAPCDNYCHFVSLGCPQAYATEVACQTACAEFADSGAHDATSGNSVQCRLTHAVQAAVGDGSACGAAAQNGGGICVSNAGDDCVAPFVVPSLPHQHDGDTSSASSAYHAPCNDPFGGSGSRDQVHAFTADFTGTLTATLTAEFDSLLYALGTCESGAACLDSADGVGAGSEETISFDVTSGSTYYVVVDGFAADHDESGPYVLTITAQP